MALGKSAVVMVGLSGTITSIKNDVRIVPYSQMMRTTIVKKNTTTSIGETGERSQVKKMLLMLAGNSVRQRKPFGKTRRRGRLRLRRIVVPTKRRSVRRYSMSLMSSLTSRGKLQSQESHEMTQ